MQRHTEAGKVPANATSVAYLGQEAKGDRRRMPVRCLRLAAAPVAAQLLAAAPPTAQRSLQVPVQRLQLLYTKPQYPHAHMRWGHTRFNVNKCITGIVGGPVRLGFHVLKMQPPTTPHANGIFKHDRHAKAPRAIHHA